MLPAGHSTVPERAVRVDRRQPLVDETEGHGGDAFRKDGSILTHGSRGGPLPAVEAPREPDDDLDDGEPGDEGGDPVEVGRSLGGPGDGLQGGGEDAVGVAYGDTDPDGPDVDPQPYAATHRRQPRSRWSRAASASATLDAFGPPP